MFSCWMFVLSSVAYASVPNLNHLMGNFSTRQTDDTFSYFVQKMGLTCHANCLNYNFHERSEPIFLKIGKCFMMLSAEFLPSMLSVEFFSVRHLQLCYMYVIETLLGHKYYKSCLFSVACLNKVMSVSVQYSKHSL